MKRLLTFLALVSVAHAVGTVQTSLQLLNSDNQQRPTSYVAAFVWTGDASTGSVPSTSLGLICCTGWFVVTAEFAPGSPSPTNNYSATITDAAGADILAGAASALSATVAQSFAASTGASPIQGSITLNITGQSVAGAKGTVYVYINRPGVVNSAKVGANFSGVLSAVNGGTGVSSPTAHTVAVAEGSNGFNFAGPGTSGQPLVSNGAADPTYQTLPASGGGTGVVSPTAHTVPVAEGASAFTFAGPGTTGQPLVSNGAASDPTYQTLPATGGGTGVSSPAAHAVPIAEGSGAFTFASPGTAGNILTSNGAAADPTLQVLAPGNQLPAGTQTQYLRVQPNTGNNTTTQFVAKDLTNITDYNFPAQTPGGSISVGANTITLTPCPLGVAGADTNHLLYISAGTGTAEAVPITGGTCTSGASTGTVTITAANTHTGAWTVTSATAGLQEAGNLSHSIFVPNGTYLIQAAATFVGDETISCASNNAMLQAQTATQNILVSNTPSTLTRFMVINCNLSAAVTKTAGDAIQLNGTGGVSNRGAIIQNVLCQSQWNCVHSVSAGHWSVENSTMLAGQNWDIYIQNTNGTDAGDNFIVNSLIDNSNASIGGGIHWESGGGLYITNTKILNHATGIDIRAADGVTTSVFMIANNSIELFSGTGINLNRLNSTGVINNVVITGNEIVTAATATNGIVSNSGSNNVLINGNFISTTGTNSSCFNILNTGGAEVNDNKCVGPNFGLIWGSGNTGVLSATQNQFSTTTNLYQGTAVVVDNVSALPFSQLTLAGFTPSNGSLIFCTDCNATCAAGASTGRTCFRENGAWVH